MGKVATIADVSVACSAADRCRGKRRQGSLGVKSGERQDAAWRSVHIQVSDALVGAGRRAAMPGQAERPRGPTPAAALRPPG